jgi:hypothetical protein
MVLRVVQWATGNVGRGAIEGIVSHPELELVGAWVHSKDKAGRDVGEICGLGPLGVQATNDMDEILRLRPDCVLYAPLLPNRQEVVHLLESGINVVTPLNWFYPGKRDVDDLRAACEAGGVTLHGTGIQCVSAIPYVCQADPGIKTYLDLPLVTGRAAPELSSR